MHIYTCSYTHLERLVPTVGQHVSLEPALTRGWGVINFTSLPQTHKHLKEDKEEISMNGRADEVGGKVSGQLGICDEIMQQISYQNLFVII